MKVFLIQAIVKFLTLDKKKSMPLEFQNIESFKDMPNNYFERGKMVRVINNRRYVQYIHQLKGGWDESMSKCINQICKVIEVDHDGLIKVKTQTNDEWFLNRSVLTSVDDGNENIEERLFAAIENGNTELFIKLIEVGKLNCINKDGRTPINLACYLGKKEIVAFLSDFSADITISDNYGNKPCYNCILKGHEDILEIILHKYPKSIHETNSNGQTLMDIAKEMQNEKIEQFIIVKMDEENINDQNSRKYSKFNKSLPSTDYENGYSDMEKYFPVFPIDDSSKLNLDLKISKTDDEIKPSLFSKIIRDPPIDESILSKGKLKFRVNDSPNGEKYFPTNSIDDYSKLYSVSKMNNNEDKIKLSLYSQIISQPPTDKSIINIDLSLKFNKKTKYLDVPHQNISPSQMLHTNMMLTKEKSIFQANNSSDEDKYISPFSSKLYSLSKIDSEDDRTRASFHYETSECYEPSMATSGPPQLPVKMVCRNCFSDSVNYLTTCGHCYCESCMKIIDTCKVCSELISENPLKIFI